LRQRTFSVEHDLEILASRLITQPRDPRGLSGFLGCPAKRGKPVEFARIGCKRAFGLLQCGEPGPVEGSERGIGAGFGLSEARARGSHIRKIPRYERAEREAKAVRGAEPRNRPCG